MAPRPERLVAALVVLDLVGARVALRHELVGEPLRIRAPEGWPTPVLLVAWGTAVSAPWWMDLTLLASLADADDARTRRALRNLGALRAAGVLMEPATWGRRRPRGALVLSAAHLALAAACIAGPR